MNKKQIISKKGLVTRENGISSSDSFTQKVLRVVSRIPAGHTLTYKQVAQKAGSPNAYRAVGSIMRKNENPQTIPCFRVVRSNGTAGKYSYGGTKEKLRRLKKEGIIF